MTEPDLAFVGALVAAGRITDPVLELGGGYGGTTCREVILASRHRYVATDLNPAAGVDFIADFQTGEGVDEVEAAGPFGTVLVLNVLEHTFNPIAVLDNVVRITAAGGRIVVITPAIWPIHNYPLDCCRLLPDWYRHFAESRRLILEEATFQYIGIGPVATYRTTDGQDHFPLPAVLQPVSRFWSRSIHKLFNTFGRGMSYPSHVAIGVCLVRV